MEPLYAFGLSQEDERTEEAALGPAGKRVLSVASAGDMPLCLLALGADRVDAVDRDVAQLHLLELKLAAVRVLDRREAVAFLGFLPAPEAERRRWLGAVADALPPRAKRFWERNERAALGGAIWAGRYERFVRRLAGLLRPLGRGAVEALLDAPSLAVQAEVFRSRFDRPLLRAAFRVAFAPAVFTSRAMPPASLAHRASRRPLGEQYFQDFRALCTATPARENHLLQLHLSGRVLSSETVPAWLAPGGFERVRANAGRLTAVHADLVDTVLRAPPGRWDAAHLSNIPDWLAQPRFEELVAALPRALAPGGRAVWRWLHVDRRVPPALAELVRTDRALGERLRARDRFPFYRVVPATVAWVPTPVPAPVPVLAAGPAGVP